ncbi:AbrB/MazE/SpoVT family DNA-binding domain-containing protein [Thermoactinomyces sp. CICC 24227]|jgi:AbrB family looped-hinge helix DNA binding protein|nr:AbrB/MazE/SpoVT family DNA-binding domain-containing protein [Thermoactinomyces sp. CICC 24227]
METKSMVDRLGSVYDKDKEESMNQKKKGPVGKYAGTAKVGTKGQIVIPKEIRDMFDIQPGETLLLFADVERGIAVMKSDALEDVFETVPQWSKKDE